MIGDTRVRVAAGLLFAVLATLGSAQAAPAATSASTVSVRYACDAHQMLTMQRSRTAASVQFVGRSYDLQRKRSSIGEKYVSPTAALIIDGVSAVFVAEDRLQLGQCF
jgi:membrane-bound inhibitor of C-type lysozyme